MLKFTRPFALLAALSLSLATQAATITPILPSPGEPDLSETLDAIYGAGNYTRIDDDSDQTWAAGQITVSALSTYAGAVQTLGLCIVCDGSDDVLFAPDISVDGIFSTTMTVSGNSIVTVGSPFTWFDFAQFHPFVGKVYSNPAMNPLLADHMVTFGVNGQPGTFILAFEDWLHTSTPGPDSDYQDLIFQVTYLQAPPSANVPEPGALFSMAGGLAALYYLRRRKTGGQS